VDPRIREESFAMLTAYTSISNRFEADTLLEVQDASGTLSLHERTRPTRFAKDYDAVEAPARWPELFDVSLWALFAAYAGGHRVGGAIAARDTDGVDLLEGRSDLVVLWDLRVAQTSRRAGVASALCAAVETWARAHGALELKVETQDVNVAACRFYERQGFRLAQAHRNAYADFPDETQLIWRKPIAPVLRFRR
jgi:GNAT superfamily N-acetyltransferase